MKEPEKKLKMAMAAKGVKSFVHLSNISGVSLDMINRFKSGGNVGIKAVADMFESMGYELVAVSDNK